MRLIIIVFLLLIIYYLIKTKNEHFKNKPSSKNENVIVETNNNSNICVVMVGDEKIIDFFQKAIDINNNYCKENNYDFYGVVGRLLDKNKHAPHFDRYKLILDKFKQNYEYVIYIDSDAYIQTPEIKLEYFINMIKDTNKFMLASYDCQVPNRNLVINSGVILLKNNKMSKNFCKDVLNKYPKCHLKKCGGFHDQSVIDKLTEYHPHIKLIKYGILQIFPRNIKKCIQKYVDTRKTAFIFHVSGVSNDYRINHFKKLK